MAYGRKTVWVLGAGFSRSLGGPLLADLLTERGKLEFKSRFEGLKDTYFYWPYILGLRGNRNAQMQLWSDVEEFLEFVERGLKPGSNQAILKKLLTDYVGANCSVEDLHKRVVQSVAGDCSFADFSDTSFEAWEPYHDWYRSLNEKDTVVTFNYDTVVERLGERSEKNQTAVNRVNTIRPWDSEISTRPHLLKLHGSIDWCYRRSQTSGALTENGYVGTLEKEPTRWDRASEGSLPLIGTPGPSKSESRRLHFKQLWVLATHHIREAENIVFLGYRFPPSDAQSRKEILGAIAENKNPYVRVHLVLGPDINGPDTIRLQKMIETVLKGQERNEAPSDDVYTSKELNFPSYRVIRQPLLVQDFFTVMNQRMLDGWKEATPAERAADRRAGT